MRQPVCLIVSLSLWPLPPLPARRTVVSLSPCLFGPLPPSRLAGPLSLCLFGPRPRPPPSTLSLHYPSGHTGPGIGPRNLACGGRLCVLERWASEAEEVPDCSRLNWWVISNHQPPMTLRAGPQGTGESSREWGGSEALPPPPGLCAWAGYPFSPPSEGGCRGTECCPFFCSICCPQSGRVGNETMPFFLASFSKKKTKSGFRPCFQELTLDHFFIKNGRCHNSSDLTTDGTASKARYFSIKTGLASAFRAEAS